MNFNSIKTSIGREIRKTYGTFAAFMKHNPELDLTASKLSHLLNPNSNSTIETLQKILDPLDCELKIGKKDKFKKA